MKCLFVGGPLNGTVRDADTSLPVIRTVIAHNPGDLSLIAYHRHEFGPPLGPRIMVYVAGTDAESWVWPTICRLLGVDYR